MVSKTVSRYGSADDMAVSMCTEIFADGRVSDARGQRTYDLKGWSGVLTNPGSRIMHNPVRGLRKGYAAASVAWNLGMRDDVDSICRWNPNGRRISDDGETFFGANYGQRMMPYLREALQLLSADPGTRRAWVPIWTPQDLWDGDVEVPDDDDVYSREGKDVPCTLGFGLSLDVAPDRPAILDMEVVMRSQAAWGVFPYDLYLFSVLQELCANELSAITGDLAWHCLSAHIYERELEWVTQGMKAAEDLTLGPPMEAIPVTLGEALVQYPRVFDDLLRDRVEALRVYGAQADPVIGQMLDNAHEIESATVNA